MGRGIAAVLLSVTLALAGCSSDEPSEQGQPVELEPAVASTSSSTTADSTDSAAPAASDGPFADVPDAPVTVVFADGAVRTLDPATGSVLEELVAPAVDGRHATAATQDPSGAWYITTVDRADDCGGAIHRLVDGELEELQPGRAPVFNHDGTLMAYLEDGFARAGEERPLDVCVYDTVVVEELATGSRWVWRQTLPADLDPDDPYATEDFYQLGGTPGAMEFSPDSATLVFGIFGEGFATYTLDLTAAPGPVTAQPLTIDDEVVGLLEDTLPNGYGLTSPGWNDDGTLRVTAFSYHWDGWAEAVATDGVVTEVTATSPERIGPTPVGVRHGFELIADRSGETARLVLVAPDGTEMELARDIRSARW